MNNQVGLDIRALRKSRGMTLRDVAQAVDRSIGWLSLIERGNATPSVSDLERIATLFDRNISFFFRSSSRDPEERGVVVRADDQVAIGSDDSGLVEELLSPTLSGAFEMIRSTFAPRASSGGPKKPRLKEDGGVLVSGRLTLTIGATRFDLGPGDSFQFDAQEYSWDNPHDEPAVVIWVISPPIY